MPNIRHIDPFRPLSKCSLIWTQIILQTTEIVFPHHPLLLEVWMEISMNFHGLKTILWPLRVYEHGTPLNIPYMDNQKVKADHLTWCEGQG